MKVALFGSAGRLGRNILEGLFEKNLSVRALIHNTPIIQPVNGSLDIVIGDVHRGQDVYLAIAECDAVIVSLGSWGVEVPDVASAGIKNIIWAMKAHGLRKIVSVTGSAAYTSQDHIHPHPYLLARHQSMELGSPDLLRDGEKHLASLEQCDLDWTVVRAPIMKDLPMIDYRLSLYPPHPATILPYRSVAEAMIGLLESKEWIDMAPFIGPLN